MVKNMGGNILGGIFPRENPPGENLIGGNFPVLVFQRGNFPDTIFIIKKKESKNFILQTVCGSICNFVHFCK